MRLVSTELSQQGHTHSLIELLAARFNCSGQHILAPAEARSDSEEVSAALEAVDVAVVAGDCLH